MSYQEKRTITSLVSGALILAAYCIYVFGKYQSGLIAPDDLRFWAVTMLIFTGIGIVASIIIQIVFHILFAISIAVKQVMENEKKCDDKEINKTIKASITEDEMDKLIKLKSMSPGLIFAGVGFVAGLILLALNYSPVVLLNILFVSWYAGSLADGFLRLHYYKKGVKNV